VIRLDLLDETELASLDEFFQSQQGRFGSFSFADPRDGTTYADCSLESDEFASELADEMRGKTALAGC
jgi:hypothetical protein